MAPFCGWWLSHTPEKSEMFMAKNDKNESISNHPPVFQDGPNIAKQQKSTQNPFLFTQLFEIYLYLFRVAPVCHAQLAIATNTRQSHRPSRCLSTGCSEHRMEKRIPLLKSDNQINPNILDSTIPYHH